MNNNSVVPHKETSLSFILWKREDKSAIPGMVLDPPTYSVDRPYLGDDPTPRNALHPNIHKRQPGTYPTATPIPCVMPAGYSVALTNLFYHRIVNEEEGKYCDVLDVHGHPAIMGKDGYIRLDRDECIIEAENPQIFLRVILFGVGEIRCWSKGYLFTAPANVQKVGDFIVKISDVFNAKDSVARFKAAKDDDEVEALADTILSDFGLEFSTPECGGTYTISEFHFIVV